MTKFIGRKVNIGIGKESVRGTEVAATFWLPKMELTHDDKIEQVINESSVGVIEDANGADITLKMSEGSLTGRANDISFGLWLLATLGAEGTPTLVGGETVVFDHDFSVLESAQHPSLTIAVEEPNATGASGLRFALSLVDSLEIRLTLGEYIQYVVGFRGNSNVVGTNTPSYSTTENIFLPQHAEAKFATDLSGLDAAPAVAVKVANFTVSKNLEDDQVVGNIQASDRLNKQFAVEGTLEILYDDRTLIDSQLLTDTQKALRIRFTNTDITLGVASNPQLTFDFAKVKLSEIARAQANNDLVRQTLTFKAFYSLTDAAMMTAILRNLQTGAY